MTATLNLGRRSLLCTSPILLSLFQL
ncbi:hypothetical protein Ahy_B08g090368 isoform E [Arachis hypogaea]|uniref:Uncharacterized protein n=1 Tax=Arachis hypogaea TaxID=3818 RepID=A0A444Y030_ARAHY|nr:hypothetical protein Ahy_B08g090368 isoform E [Arachis hypogaea]